MTTSPAKVALFRSSASRNNRHCHICETINEEPVVRITQVVHFDPNIESGGRVIHKFYDKFYVGRCGQDLLICYMENPFDSLIDALHAIYQPELFAPHLDKGVPFL